MKQTFHRLIAKMGSAVDGNKLSSALPGCIRQFPGKFHASCSGNEIMLDIFHDATDMKGAVQLLAGIVASYLGRQDGTGSGLGENCLDLDYEKCGAEAADGFDVFFEYEKMCERSTPSKIPDSALTDTALKLATLGVEYLMLSA